MFYSLVLCHSNYSNTWFNPLFWLKVRAAIWHLPTTMETSDLKHMPQWPSATSGRCLASDLTITWYVWFPASKKMHVKLLEMCNRNLSNWKERSETSDDAVQFSHVDCSVSNMEICVGSILCVTRGWLSCQTLGPVDPFSISLVMMSSLSKQCSTKKPNFFRNCFQDILW